MSVARIGQRSQWVSGNQSPTTSEDLAAGYRVGDEWIRTDTGQVWRLTDESAGTWTELAAPASTGAADGLLVDFREHFLTIPGTTTTLAGRMMVTASGAGASVVAQPTTEVRRPGIAQLTTGTTAAGRVALHTFADGIRLGGGPWDVGWGVRPTTLSTAGERWQLVVGLINSPAALTQVDGVYFLLDEGGVHTGSTASGNWWAVTANASSRTFTDTGIAAVAGTWADLRADINAAAGSVDFLVDGVVRATHTTNIPTSSTALVQVGAALFKSAGTTARTVDCDYVDVLADLS